MNNNKSTNKTDFALPALTPFVTVWRTKAGDSLNIAIAATWQGPSITIDYGDGCIDTVGDKKDLKPHLYHQAGDYEVRISSNITSFSPATKAAGELSRPKLIDVKQWGAARWKNVEAMFLNCENMNMSATDAPDLSQVSSTVNMFARCTKFNGRINHWDISNIDKGGYMLFKTPAFNQDLSNWVALSNKKTKTIKPGVSIILSEQNSFYQVFGIEQTIDDYMENYRAVNDKETMINLLSV